MLEATLAAIAGLLIGSFLNVCIYRWPRELSVVRPRSFCPQCEKPVAWYDNVPVLSYAVLGGRCRHCAERIPVRYLLVELLTAICFAGAVLQQRPAIATIELCVFAAIMIALVFADLEERILPDELTLGGAAVGFLFALIPGTERLFLLPLTPPDWPAILEAALGAGFTALMLTLVRWLFERLRHKEGLGIGDLKMIAAIGAFLGIYGAVVTVVVASIAGSIIGVIYIVVARKDAGTYELPFGSFLGAAALAVAFWGRLLTTSMSKT